MTNCPSASDCNSRVIRPVIAAAGAVTFLMVGVTLGWLARQAVSESQTATLDTTSVSSSAVEVTSPGAVTFESLAGDWQVTSVSIDGISTQAIQATSTRMTFQGSKMTSEWRAGDGKSGTTTMDFVLDDSVVPTRLTWNDPKVRSLCKLADGRLYLASYGRPEAPFPDSFDDLRDGEQLVVQILERATKNEHAHDGDGDSHRSSRQGLAEGWRREIESSAVLGENKDVTVPAQRFTARVKQGWLIVACSTLAGEMEWEVVLAKATRAEPPRIDVEPNLGFVDVQYGPYFIRENAGHLRIFREKKSQWDAACSLAEAPPQRERLQSALERLFLYSVEDGLWITAGRNESMADVRLRFHHKKLAATGGMSSQGFRDGKLAIVACGEATCQDDGDLLVATRIPAYAAKAEIRTSVIRQGLQGHAAPEIQASRWFQTTGPLELESLRGKVVLLDFWGTWCGPCVKNLPVVDALHQKFKDQGFVAIGVHSVHESEQLESFLGSHTLHFPICIDAGKSAESYAVVSWPSYVLIDKSGIVVTQATGVPPTEQQIAELIARPQPESGTATNPSVAP